jgi:DNA-binding NtrC family response regulator
LRERAEDILWFARQFVRDYVNTRPNEPRSLHPLTEQALRAYPWPGNVRELRHCIERACILSRSPVIAPEACFDDAVNPHQSVAAISGNLGRYLQECERSYILAALERQSWQIGRSAEILGISRKNLWEKMRKLGISEQHVRSESDSR